MQAIVGYSGVLDPASISAASHIPICKQQQNCVERHLLDKMHILIRVISLVHLLCKPAQFYAAANHFLAAASAIRYVAYARPCPYLNVLLQTEARAKTWLRDASCEMP